MPSPEYASLHLHAKVDELVAPYFADGTAVGLVVGVLRGDERHVYGYGKLAKDRPGPPDESTIFEIGSITKVFTGLLLADMIARGEVQLHDPVQKFLPSTVRVPTYHGQQITLYHLSTHTSALPTLPGDFDQTVKDEANPYASYTVQHLYESLNKTKLRQPPGTVAEYSNLGVGLLGHALSLVAGKPYEELIKERVCQPLGLLDTTITLTDEQRQRLAPGHTAEGEPTANWDLPTLAGAGALRSTVEQMLRFLEANLKAKTHPLREALETCHVVYPLPRPPLSWSFGWAVTMAVIGLALQAAIKPTPGGLGFSALLYPPIALAALLGGPIQGLLTAVLSVGGSWWLWRDEFAWLWPTVISLGVAGFFSLSHWFQKDEALLGWQISRLVNNVPLVWHNGGTGGYRSYCAFVQQSRTAVVVLGNSENEVDAIGQGVLDYLHESNKVWATVERSCRP